MGKEDPKYQRISVRVRDQAGLNEYEALSYNIRESKRSTSSGGYKQYAPSIQYKSCIVNGARENNFPSEYLRRLERIKDNQNPYRRKGVGSACDAR